jgi:serine/threonine protein kinase
MNVGSPQPTAPPQTDGKTESAHGTASEPIVVPEDPDRTRAGGTGGFGTSAKTISASQLIGEYTVVRKIGEGGMGAVYLAEDTKLGRKVAIKTMKPELAADQANRERFEREARAAAAVEHENIVPIWGIGEAADGSPYIAMPFLQGEMLADRLRRQPVPGLVVLIKVAREVAEGLAAAHAKGLIHRDIKPGNIWLEGDPTAKEPGRQVRRCKILDFGLARTVQQDDMHLTASGVVMGTPAYMSPEQAMGEPVDHRSDLFSLGVVLYRMATGQMPFSGATSMAVMIALATETPTATATRNPNLPPAVAQLIDSLLSKKPAGRPESASEMCATLRQIVKDIQFKNAASAAVARPSSAALGRAAPVQTPAPAPKWEEVADAEGAKTTGPEPGTDEHEPGTEPVLKVALKPTSRPLRKGPVPKAPVLRAEVLLEPELEPETAAPTQSIRARKAQRQKQDGRSPNWWWYGAGGVFALFAVIALAVLVMRVGTAEGELVVEIDDPNVEARIKNGRLVVVGPDGKDRYTLAPSEHNKKLAAGPYTVRVEGADGLAIDTPEFTLKKGDKVVVRVTHAPKVPKTVDPPPALPPGPNPPPGPDPEVDRKAAEYVLSVGGTVRINNQKEIKAAKDLPGERFQLTTVDVFGSKQVTDEGMKVFAGCTHVTVLNVSETRVSEAGLAHFKGCKGLQFLAVGSADRAQKFGDTGLALFDECKDLRLLWMGGTQVTEAGLAALKNHKRLTDFRFSNSALSDAGLVHIKECPELTYLWIPDTKVTAKGAADLAKALPRCAIHWSGGKIEPPKK